MPSGLQGVLYSVLASHLLLLSSKKGGAHYISSLTVAQQRPTLSATSQEISGGFWGHLSKYA